MKKYLNYIILAASLVFGVLALALMAAPGVKIEGILDTYKISSFEIMTGESSTYLVGNMSQETSVGMVFALIFAILGVIAPIALCALKALKVKKVPYGIIAFACAAVALVAGILLFCAKTFFLAGNNDFDGLTLGVGAVFAGIFGVLNACALGFFGVKNMK